MTARAEWNRLWVWMWGVIAVSLIAAAFILPFNVWSIAVLIGFGVPETIGIWRRSDRYPPLTFVIRRYTPRWFTFTAIYGVFGTIASYWFGGPQPLRMGFMFAALGWLTNHFSVVYDGEGE